MKLVTLTLVLDGEPFIERHIPIFEASGLDWQWIVVEGQAAPTKDTGWCKPMPFRTSQDGTHEYLKKLHNKYRGKIIHLHQTRWENKTSMCNAGLGRIIDDCVLLQVDSDEIWTPEQLRTIVEIFDYNKFIARMHFYCRYFVGPDIIILEDGTTPFHRGEWIRAWRWKRGFRFDKHEPPILSGNKGRFMYPWATEERGLVFDHFSYATEQQVAYKEKFYGYDGALAGWKRLQANDKWPVKLKDFLPWCGEDCYAQRI